MGIIGWIVLGALAGWVASMITGQNERMGCLMNIIIGILGAFVGGLIMSLVGFGGASGFNLWSFIVATLGAVILLLIIGAVRSRT